MPEGRTVINNDNWTHIVGCTGLRQASLASVGAKGGHGWGSKVATEREKPDLQTDDQSILSIFVADRSLRLF